MNRFPMLSTAPKGMRSVPKPGAPSDVSAPSVRKARNIRPGPASTRDYGKTEEAPLGSDMFGGPRV